jgi:phenylacetate-CoA ligase
VMIEPVDRDYCAVSPGEISHTVLLTNLANHVQPIIRYDLGDSNMMRTESCACGSPFPALRVEGRSDEVLSLRNACGDRVELPPLALTTVVEEFAGAHQFQIIQTAPDTLSVRVEASNGAAGPVLWGKVARTLRAYLDAQGLPAVAVRHDRAPLEHRARSGKLRRVVAARTG